VLGAVICGFYWVEAGVRATRPPAHQTGGPARWNGWTRGFLGARKAGLQKGGVGSGALDCRGVGLPGSGGRRYPVHDVLPAIRQQGVWPVSMQDVSKKLPLTPSPGLLYILAHAD